ncbi:PQQ-binding-like beta-propeller repeat protein [Pseudemcibacter aquimaris]|uniref:outer membrane protein assembly factor BamB family protein n=1 Tax=Pseudemcibacter aquimaris TaxID=2857064 RepID=UPI00201230D2|nr:PQQ-binding-like beta-propeller repeat protein [Pseudemcibacter aquimaris]MCC3861534.1 PQQ-binding-like beta-propeller repeat protein [Pseudemcibacter aquimaris]WDU58303.1 PQQ-binding-like beta-propeller repeat protein [Pseudemcibacter aquimaris]
MKLNFKKSFAALTMLATGLASSFAMAEAPGTENGEWHHYTGDIKGSRYTALDQINADNFEDLEMVWNFSTKNLGTRGEYKLEVTPLMVDGVLYATAGTRRTAIALDAATGELMWLHSMREGLRGGMAPRQLSGRGLSYWSDGNGDDRVYYVTTGYRLIALNAHTGVPIDSFGPDGNGILDLKVGAVQGNEVQIDLVTGEIGLHATPTVVGDMIIVGSAMKEGMTIDNYNNTKGLVRAFDIRTGEKIWQFDPIPRPGQFGNDTWLDNSWERNGNTGVWTQITVDEKNELVFLAVESPSSDFYGGHRPGPNLFGESLVAVDLKTGEYRWHFQVVHHPIWDHDLSSAPLIMDVTIDGKDREIIALPTKQAFIYAFDRVTGEPIWDIPEVPVPQGNIPGEWYSPTQPMPPMHLMYGRGKLDLPNDLIDFTPELRQAALDKMHHWDWSNGGMYNPPIEGDVNGTLGAINIGATNGGTNWPGASFDPETGIVYAPASMIALNNLSMAPPPEGYSNVRYMAGRKGQQFRMRNAAGTGQNPDAPKEVNYPVFDGPRVEIPGLNVEGLSILKPPYGVIAAIDMNKGEVIWQAPHGETPDNVRNHPKLRGLDIPRTGQSGALGVVVTKTLVIAGDYRVTNPGDRERGAMLRAYDKMTGENVGEVWMPAGQSGSPMSYMVDGRQFIIVSVSGGAYPGEFRAYALPED